MLIFDHDSLRVGVVAGFFIVLGCLRVVVECINIVPRLKLAMSSAHACLLIETDLVVCNDVTGRPTDPNNSGEKASRDRCIFLLKHALGPTGSSFNSQRHNV